jgi:hypothetical protein
VDLLDIRISYHIYPYIPRAATAHSAAIAAQP